MKRLIVLLTLMIGLLLASCGSGAAGVNTAHNARKWRLEETYLIRAAQGKLVSLEILAPITYGCQKVGEIKVTGVDSFKLSQEGKLSLISAELIGTGGEQKVILTYDVELLTGAVAWRDEVKETDLLPGKQVQSDDPLIVSTAEKLLSKGDDYSTARDMASFVTSTLTFDYSPKINQEQPTVMEILNTRKGVCADYANLTTALLRASGIRARSVSGLALKDLAKAGEWSHQAGAHAWVEFLSGNAWHFADPTWGNSLFDHADGYHLSFGDADAETLLYDSILKRYQSSDMTIIGAMSAPLKFVCASEDKNATLTPSGIVKPLQ